MRRFATLLTTLLFSLSLGMLNTGTAQAVGYGYWGPLENGYYLGAPSALPPRGTAPRMGRSLPNGGVPVATCSNGYSGPTTELCTSRVASA